MKVKSESEVTQSCPTLSNPMDCSLPGSSVHGIFQARVLEWGAITFSDTVLVFFPHSSKLNWCITMQLQEKAMATHSSTLAWKIPWTEEPGGLQSMALLRVGTTEKLYFHFSLSCIREGNGNPLQCSCLENPRDGGAW